ncbi:hypothetical protein L2E82_48877 [Cichorium intybus]|uniref:Uncharacterized protein n=1 Tax=Cichorium intybus TaxID=13427 RepID=A0ACB8Z058_CICIN|nr:hypothetical protein L2E82_48877 [Cichorium intybus]
MADVAMYWRIGRVDQLYKQGKMLCSLVNWSSRDCRGFAKVGVREQVFARVYIRSVVRFYKPLHSIGPEMKLVLGQFGD